MDWVTWKPCLYLIASHSLLYRGSEFTKAVNLAPNSPNFPCWKAQVGVLWLYWHCQNVTGTVLCLKKKNNHQPCCGKNWQFDSKGKKILDLPKMKRHWSPCWRLNGKGSQGVEVLTELSLQGGPLRKVLLEAKLHFPSMNTGSCPWAQSPGFAGWESCGSLARDTLGPQAN